MMPSFSSIVASLLRAPQLSFLPLGKPAQCSESDEEFDPKVGNAAMLAFMMLMLHV